LQSGSVQYVLNVLFTFTIIKGFYRPIAILLLLHFWLSCGSNSDAKPDFDLIPISIWYSVILLFFSKTMKKDLIFKFLQSGSVRIKWFVYMQCICMHLLFLARLPKTMHSTISILFYISCMKDWKDCDFNNVFNVLTKYQI
jgi:hypothetical protein